MANYDKFGALEYLFFSKTAGGKQGITSDIDFTLKEVGQAIVESGGKMPTSWSNFVLDLTRKDRGIDKRLPKSVIDFGYDLRKKTGDVPGVPGEKYCGTFIYRGKDEDGNTIPLNDWLKLDQETPDQVIPIDNRVPDLVKAFLTNDEASLFSVIDYCDILSTILKQKVYRVQCPMKWQPNEIDGFYVAESENRRNVYIYPVEAKAASTHDDINLVQIYGQYHTLVGKYSHRGFNLIVRPIAVRMTETGMVFAILEHNALYDPDHNSGAEMFSVHQVLEVVLNPGVEAWKQNASGFSYHPPTRELCETCQALLRSDTRQPIILARDGKSSDSNGYPFHDWYNFVLGFTPAFPSYMLNREGISPEAGDIVLDPFVGSGTTQLVCKLRGVKSIGIDANDFMVFAASQKLNWGLDAGTISALRTDIVDAYKAAAADIDWTNREFLEKRAAALRPEMMDSRYISDKPLLKIFLLRQAVDALDAADEYKDLFRFAISSILVPVSNVKYGPGFGVSKAKDDADVLAAFCKKIDLMVRDLSALSDEQKNTASRTILGDSRRLSQYVDPDSVALIITSPPYPGDHEYTKHSKLELVFQGFATSLSSFRTIKKRMIRGSTTNIYREDHEGELVHDVQEIVRITGEIARRLDKDGATSGYEKLYTRLVWEYFGGMAQFLREAWKVLKPGGKIALLVSDSHAFKMVHIETGKILRTIGESLGFTDAELLLWQKKLSTSHKYQLRENILVMRKPE